MFEMLPVMRIAIGAKLPLTLSAVLRVPRSLSHLLWAFSPPARTRREDMRWPRAFADR